ncbi:hypothetical protein TNCV_5025751 [Trichonephila clavipes]|nr:hypothetical protein TNCV_5025751 [Trichonephila clavipes]
MTTPVLTVQNIVRRLPSIGRYHPAWIGQLLLTGLESNRACVGICLVDEFQPASPTHLSTELRWALLDEWCNILHHQFDNLILSMPRRL